MRGFCVVILSLALESGNSWSVSPSSSIRRPTNLATSSSNAATEVLPSTTKTQVETVPVPLDDNYSPNPIKRIQSFFTSFAGLSEQKGLQHDEYLKQSGGVWKTKFLLTETYSVSGNVPDLVKELSQAEAKGYLKSNWPESVVNVLGHDSLIAASDTDDLKFKTARKVFSEALSLKTILDQSLPAIEKEVASIVAKWETASAANETVVFSKDISSLTYKIIVRAVFGESLTEEETILIRQSSDIIGKGLFAVPKDNFIVRKIPFFRRYANAMDARQTMKELVEDIVLKKKTDLANGSLVPNGILDALLINSVLPEDEIVSFCVDNVILSVFAGFDTTASLTTNLAMILVDDPIAQETLRSELQEFDCQKLPPNTLEVLDTLPCLNSAVHESFRYRPPVGGSFRKTVQPIVLGRVEIPANATVQWANLQGSRSQALYKEPSKACPLRFLNDPKQPRPSMFGYGKHKCPGQYLAQLEMALIMQAFLCNFEYSLDANQDTSPSVPFLVPKSGLRMKLTRLGQ